MGILGSAFGRALSGGGMAAASIADKYIDEELLVQRQQAIADIQRASAMAQRVDADTFSQSNRQRDIGQKREDAMAAGDTQTAVDTARAGNEPWNTARRGQAAGDAAAARAVELERLRDQPLNEAARDKVAGDAAAASKIKNDQTIADANNPQLLAAGAKVKLADPEIAARIAASRASANSSNASAGLHSAQTEGVKVATGALKRLDGLHEDMSKVLSDPNISDTERAKRMADLEKQITLARSRAGTGTRNPELDVTTTESFERDANGEVIKKTTTKDTRRAGNSSPGRGAGAEEDALVSQARAAIAAGADPEKVEERLQKHGKTLGGNSAGSRLSGAQEPTRKDPISGMSLTQKAWDKKYGKGDFQNLYRPGEDSLRPF